MSTYFNIDGKVTLKNEQQKREIENVFDNILCIDYEETKNPDILDFSFYGDVSNFFAENVIEEIEKLNVAYCTMDVKDEDSDYWYRYIWNGESGNTIEGQIVYGVDDALEKYDFTQLSAEKKKELIRLLQNSLTAE